MGKSFAPRTAKKDRKTTEISQTFNKDLFKLSDQRLLQGAQLMQIQLNKITVRDQVRTKFNDDSLRELAENIRANGLIQPLVIHREGDKFVLLCGERRFRAMNLIAMSEAPCFILEGKSKEELMAIQFSENSSREELHYIDKADGIYNYHLATGASERKIEADLGISKSEVHRSLLIAKLPKNLREAAKIYNIEKYVLVEYHALEESSHKQELEKEILGGRVTKRSQFQQMKKLLIPSAKGKKGRIPEKSAQKEKTAKVDKTNKALVVKKTRKKSTSSTGTLANLPSQIDISNLFN